MTSVQCHSKSIAARLASAGLQQFKQQTDKVNTFDGFDVFIEWRLVSTEFFYHFFYVFFSFFGFFFGVLFHFLSLIELSVEFLVYRIKILATMQRAMWPNQRAASSRWTTNGPTWNSHNTTEMERLRFTKYIFRLSSPSSSSSTSFSFLDKINKLETKFLK